MHNHSGFGRPRLHPAVLSVALAALAAGALIGFSSSSAGAQTPQLVTNPDGSVSYVTATNGSALVNTPNGASYVTANGNATLVTNPGGSVSYVNVNGNPSLVVGPDGSFSYQNVIAGPTAFGGATLAYGGASNLTNSTAVTTTTGLNPLIPPQSVAATGRISVAPQAVSGRYCDLVGGGQVWIDYGAPSGDATCSS